MGRKAQQLDRFRGLCAGRRLHAQGQDCQRLLDPVAGI